jgi:adenine-specific DNA-methyltransferase
MIRDEIESVETASPNILDEQIEQLKLIYPEAFIEGKIDFKKLRAALGDVVDAQPERYSFTWAGKRDATLLLQAPVTQRLHPQ